MSEENKTSFDFSDLDKFIIVNAVPLKPEHYEDPSYNRIRRSKLLMLSAIMNQRERFKTIKDSHNIITEIERACYEYTVNKANDINIIPEWNNELFVDIYDASCARVFANLSTDNSVCNTFLFDAILDGKIAISDIPKVTSQDLFPGKDKDLIEKIEASKNVVRTERVSNLYVCKHCKRNECIVDLVQLRSLDEGSNLSIKCKNCGRTWIL